MRFEVFFENHKQVIENELSKAKMDVYIAVAWINFREYYPIFDSLLRNNINLEIICSDNFQNRSHQEFITKLIKGGAKIKLLRMPHSKNHMHHKFAIIDNHTVLNGSFNWSPNATKSFENLMILNGSSQEISKFIEEYKKLKLIETDTIKNLTNLKKCDCCDSGKIVNILVFSSKASKYFETSGDIVHVCTDCDFFENGSEMITNNQLYILADIYNSFDNEEDHEKIDRSIFDELNQYINNGIIIHAIGQVTNRLSQYDEEYTQTIIFWKNKFVGNIIPDCYEDQNFDVYYDHTTYL